MTTLGRMSDEVDQASERDGVDPILRYGTLMLAGLVIAGFVGLWLEAGFRNGAAVGIAVGILVAYLLGKTTHDDEVDG